MSDTSSGQLAIQAQGLTKNFKKRRVALSNFDLQVPRGEIVGLLGPNGAGKTTLIRILVGLARASRGVASILDHKVPKDLGQILPKIGVVLEAPAFYPTMSARDNLRALVAISGDPAAEKRIGPLLDQLGLGARANDAVGGYSQGMRQRLALAAALLHQPELLILDEPLTGFDPAGVVEARELFSELRSQGVTVFLSSHFLSEVEKNCDRFIFIAQGKAAGSYDQTSLKKRLSRVLVTPASDGVWESLQSRNWSVSRGDSTLIVEGVGSDEVKSQLANVSNGLPEVTQFEMSLEELYLELTKTGSE